VAESQVRFERPLLEFRTPLRNGDALFTAGLRGDAPVNTQRDDAHAVVEWNSSRSATAKSSN
jgi:hypothetical protein